MPKVPLHYEEIESIDGKRTFYDWKRERIVIWKVRRLDDGSQN